MYISAHAVLIICQPASACALLAGQAYVQRQPEAVHWSSSTLDPGNHPGNQAVHSQLIFGSSSTLIRGQNLSDVDGASRPLCPLFV